jgi:hypothetical protein
MLHVEQAAVLQQLVLKLNLRLGLQVVLKLLLQQAELVQKAVQQLHLVRTQAQTPVSKWERIQSWGQVLTLALPLLADLMQLLQLVQHQLPWQLPQDWKQAHLQVLGMLQTRLGMLQTLLRMLQALMGTLQAPPVMQQALGLQQSLVCQHVRMRLAQSLLAPLCADMVWNWVVGTKGKTSTDGSE